jgi:hypothetical protein
MLTPQQVNYIQEHINSSDQDFFFWSSLLGEPFLEQDILTYYDGETVSLVGYSLNAQTEQSSIVRSLIELVMKWLKVPTVKCFNYFGPRPLDLSDCLGAEFSLIYVLKPEHYQADIFIDLNHASLLKTSRAKESMRKTQRLGLAATVSPRDYLSHQHIELVRRLLSRETMMMCDVSQLTNTVSILKDPATRCFDVEQDQILIGFAVAHEFFAQMPFLTLAAFDTSQSGVSDTIYLALINYYKARGARWLGLGYGVTEGLYQYKTKWGGVRCNPPVHQCIWAKSGFENAVFDYWVCNLILDKYRQQRL